VCKSTKIKRIAAKTTFGRHSSNILPMIIFHHITDVQAYADRHKHLWPNAGFVPTMGALHEGHLSLISTCKQQSSLTIASIFVNPSQFNNVKDFEKYPNTIDKDLHLLTKAGCDVLFLPSVAEMYPDGFHSDKPYDLGSLETLLEGYHRPGHFQGVCQVVDKLLQIVNPAYLFMGEKDFQQCMVVQRLIELKNLAVTLKICPTLREPHGLAMSSRNLRLSEKERQIAGAIFRQMENIKSLLHYLPLRQLEEQASENLLSGGFSSIDYVSIANPKTLTPLKEWAEDIPAVVLIAAFLGEIRLIDNLRLC
jgi:pantoate--beta-alanine ligase